LVALDAETGVQRWIYETTTPVLSLRGTSRPVITSAGSVIAGFSNGTLVAVEAENGIYLWEERLAVPEGRYDIERVIDVDGDLVLDGSRVLASSYQGNVMALDVATGRIVWGMEASSYHGMARGFGNIYYCDDRSYIVAVRDNSTDTVWQNEDLQYRQITAPTAVNNFVAVADYEGYVHLLSQIDGRIVGRIRVDNDGVRSTILARNGRIYVYGNSGRLTALSLQ
jgi:outer membrane protein assembly factor BamB